MTWPNRHAQQQRSRSLCKVQQSHFQVKRMNEIICPHCSKAFKIDETGYADIVRQVHDAEFVEGTA